MGFFTMGGLFILPALMFGGCRALGLLFAEGKDDYLREDVTKCYFFENGWYQKVTRALAGWKNQSETTLP